MDRSSVMHEVNARSILCVDSNKEQQIVDGEKVTLSRDQGCNTQRWIVLRDGPYVLFHPVCDKNCVINNAEGPQTPVDLIHDGSQNLNARWILHTRSYRTSRKTCRLNPSRRLRKVKRTRASLTPFGRSQSAD